LPTEIANRRAALGLPDGIDNLHFRESRFIFFLQNVSFQE
jgi:hypothetical protein